MASIPFVGAAIKHRRPLTGSRLIIVATAIGFLLFLIWASIAHVDEVTRGEGKVIPSSKLQIVTAADAATVSQIFVRSGQQVRRGELLVRLDSPDNASQLGQIEAETQSLQARESRLTEEGLGQATTCEGGDCAGEAGPSRRPPIRAGEQDRRASGLGRPGAPRCGRGGGDDHQSSGQPRAGTKAG